MHRSISRRHWTRSIAGGGYASLIDYHRPPPPPKLTDAELVLVDALLRAEGVR